MDRDPEAARNWALIRTPLGKEWSGRTRYAAAVFFYNRGDLDADVLEVYRICARLDHEDPLAILRDRAIGAEWLDKVAAFADAQPPEK